MGYLILVEGLVLRKQAAAVLLMGWGTRQQWVDALGPLFRLGRLRRVEAEAVPCASMQAHQDMGALEAATLAVENWGREHGVPVSEAAPVGRLDNWRPGLAGVQIFIAYVGEKVKKKGGRVERGTD